MSGADVTTLPVTEPPPKLVDDPELLAINAFRIFICAVGIPANLIVILAIHFHKKFGKTITAWYIVQLAIADTAFLVTLPFEVVETRWNSWIFPAWACKAKEAVRFINYYGSVTFLTIMAIDRYIAICHTFSERLQKLRKHRAAYIITAIVWTVCIAISLPVGIFSQVRGRKPNCICQLVFPEPPKSPTEFCVEIGMGSGDDLVFCLENSIDTKDDKEEYCKPNTLLLGSGDGSGWGSADENESLGSGTTSRNGGLGGSGIEVTYDDYEYEEFGNAETLEVGCHYVGYSDGFRGFLSFNFGVMFVVPFLIITVCYVLIIRHLATATTKRVKGASKSDKGRKRVVVMCIALVVVFAACWFPYHGVHLAKMDGISGTSDYCIKLLYATSLLVYLNSAINPFIYFILARPENLRRIRNSSLVTLFTKGRSSTSRPTSHSSSSDQTKDTGTVDSKVRETTKVL